MTDNEIIKALECEANEKVCIHEQYEQACGLWCKHYHKWCADMSGKNNKNNCSAFKPNAPTKRAKAILALINRQKAEIERLNNLNTDILVKKVLLERDLEIAKAEAYKEFAERLKEYLGTHYGLSGDEKTYMIVDVHDIDNLLKEMIGE